MAWNYLHIRNIGERELGQASVTNGESPLQAFLNRQGASGWELVFCQRVGETYELIFKSETFLMTR
jgi:hypothetical protein